MKRQRTLHLFLLAVLVSIQAQVFAQGKIGIIQREGSQTVFRLDSLDHLYKLAGDTVADHPYYTFLWVLGDGSFVNGTRDSVMRHTYELRDKRRYHLAGAGGGPDVTVYATGIYSGGSRPPSSLAAPPGDPFRSQTVQRQTFKLPALAPPNPAPLPIDTSVIDNTKTGTLRMQLNKKVRPQDTLVSIISFRQPGKVPDQNIAGQVLLFYNSRVKKAETIPVPIKKVFKGTAPPTASPPLTHGRSDFQQSLVHFTNTSSKGAGSLATEGISEYLSVAAWDYNTLSPDGMDERHVFAEFANDSMLWELFKNGVGDTLRFLAVMTAISDNPDLLGQLPQVQDAYLDSIGITNLLTGKYFSDGVFLSLGQTNQKSQIIGISEVVSPVVSAHDPNYLSLYACECPGEGRQKIAGVIDFSNDGNAGTTQLKIVLHVPPQLNLNSVETIGLVPAPTFPVQPEIDLAARTVTWTWPALLQPAESAGFGHPSTFGQVAFTIAMKEGFSLSDVQPVTACIIFDFNDPMCTLPVAGEGIVTKSEDGGIQAVLECEACKTYPDEGKTGFDMWCALLWLLGIVLLLLIVWLVKRFFS
mgnify:CR=1 FL=1